MPRWVRMEWFGGWSVESAADRRGNGQSSARVITTRCHGLPLPGGSPCPTTYLLDTVGSDQSLRKSMTTNQLSLLGAANAGVIHFRQHLVRRRARIGLMPCAFASLRLCVLTASVPTQRRRGAKTQSGLGQDAVDWIGRPRAIAEKRSARFLTGEPWTASRWSERGWAVEASVNGNVLGGSSPSRASVLIREIRVIRGQPLLAKLDDLTHQMLGALEAMFNVLILGNEQSEATTDVAHSTAIYPCNASTGARADRTEGIASLNPVGWVLTDRWAATMAALIPTVSSAKDIGKDEPPGKGRSICRGGKEWSGSAVGASRALRPDAATGRAAPEFSRRAATFSLSPGERAGVRAGVYDS